MIIAAIGNVLGILLIGLLGSYLAELTEFGSVAKTIASLANFDVSTDASLTNALIAVSAGLLSIVIWSLGSTYFGFPSSESNELVGGVTGGAMALGALAGMNWFSMVG